MAAPALQLRGKINRTLDGDTSSKCTSSIALFTSENMGLRIYNWYDQLMMAALSQVATDEIGTSFLTLKWDPVFMYLVSC